ncbi:glutaredoxin-2, mitochondrial-like [Rhopilema esculentum]|uniref:glutaredoxin-2, mitochondrial-like n=1 Tax=Rhopilema esculentum TaxID=499914 RepID=UPI0031DE11D8|eukprot:gene13139-3931_t
MGGTFSSRIKDNERVDDDSVEGAILSNCVVMFSTTTCKFCEKAKLSLANLGVRYKVIELDLLGKNSFIYSKELSLKTGVRTVPQIFVNGQFVGGYSEMEQLKEAGKLIEMVYQCAYQN